MKTKIAPSHSIALFVFALAICWPLALQAKPFSQFIEFSGALSDTGNFATINGNSPPPFFMNRTTNGPVAGELLAARLGLTALSSNHLIGPVQGTNFSVRDALAGGNRPNDLSGQLRAYFKSTGGRADPDAFYLVLNGGNDVIAAVLQPTDQLSDKIVADAIKGLETALRSLVRAGAKTIMAPNFIDVSLVPALRTTPLAPKARRISESFNRQFERMLDRVEHDVRIEFIRWDFDKIVKDTIEHGDEFGFLNVTDPCINLVLNGQADPDDFVFLTDTFPTARVHRIMAEAMALAVLQRDKACDENDRHHHRKGK